MKTTITLLASLIIASAAAQTRSAETQSRELPKVEQILAKYVQALGGRDAILKIQTLVSKGTFKTENGASTPCELVQKAPDRWLITMEDLGGATYREAMDGQTGWEASVNGIRERSLAEAAAIRCLHGLHREANLAVVFPKMNVKGKETLGTRQAYVVEATPREGRPVVMYFDTQSGLLMRQDYQIMGPNGLVSAQMEYDDYKAVEKRIFPFTMRQTGPRAWSVKFTEMKANVPVDEAKFKKPVGD